MSNLGNKKVMSKNIKYYMEENNISQTDLCKTLGFKMSTMSDWLHARTYPRIDKIEMLANYFGIDKSDLVEDKSEQSPITKKTPAKKIPVLGRVPAGVPIEAVEDIIDYEEIPEELAKTGEYFGLMIKGDSMEPRICEGDVVIVRKQEDAESGDLVIAMVNGGEATCKRLMKYADGIRLLPNNPAYEPLYYTNEDIENIPVKIVGRVMENRQKY